jgi:integrase
MMDQLQLPFSPDSVIPLTAQKPQSCGKSQQTHNMHTPGHLDCRACLEARSMFVCPLTASMSFKEAAKSFLQSRTAPVTAGRTQYISKRTFRDYQQYFKTLGIFFDEMKLEDIRPWNIARYQSDRSQGIGFTRIIGNRKGAEPVPSRAGPEKVNAELGVLKRMMLLAGAWSPELELHYMPFQTFESDFCPALSEEEQERFLAIAGSNPTWHPIWWYSKAAVHLTFSSDEMRTIRIGDINLVPNASSISVNRRYGKNKYRRRTIAIREAGCAWALERLIERAKTLAGGEPHHFLFPKRIKRNHYDPQQPMSETGLRKQFDAVRAAAGVPWFRLNGWRHTAITRLAEAGVPLPTIMRRSGHVTVRMSEHYTHISDQAERYQIDQAIQKKPVMSVSAAELRRQMSA